MLADSISVYGFDYSASVAAAGPASVAAAGPAAEREGESERERHRRSDTGPPVSGAAAAGVRCPQVGDCVEC
jgi:hypothetical protein